MPAVDDRMMRTYLGGFCLGEAIDPSVCDEPKDRVWPDQRASEIHNLHRSDPSSASAHRGGPHGGRRWRGQVLKPGATTARWLMDATIYVRIDASTAGASTTTARRAPGQCVLKIEGLQRNLRANRSVLILYFRSLPPSCLQWNRSPRTY
jgi:hypothetical protein